MSKGYQPDRYPNDQFDQVYDSGYSGPSREYSDLYNPNKSIWKQAVESKPQAKDVKKHTFTGHQHERNAPAHHKYTDSDKRLGQERAIRQAGGNYYPLAYGEEDVFDSGYDVTKRNTYGYRTTGYGPRD